MATNVWIVLRRPLDNKGRWSVGKYVYYDYAEAAACSSREFYGVRKQDRAVVKATYEEPSAKKAKVGPSPARRGGAIIRTSRHIACDGELCGNCAHQRGTSCSYFPTREGFNRLLRSPTGARKYRVDVKRCKQCLQAEVR